MQEDKNFSFKVYKKDHKHQIIRLFKKIFKINLNANNWNWKFKKNPNGKNKIVLVFFKKKLIGHCAAIKMRFQYSAKKKFFYRIQNFMVDKEYREKKIATKTLDFLISKIVKDKGHIITFPNRDISTKIFSKNSYRKIFHIFTYEKLLKKKHSIQKKFFLKNSSIVKITNNDMKLINECLQKYKVLNLRSKNYLNWRYSLNFGNYKISRIFFNKQMIGIIISKFYSRDNSICICEIFYKKGNENLRSLINSTVVNFIKNNPKKIKIWTMSHFSMHRNLLDLGFKKINFKTNVCTYKNLPKDNLFKKMYLSMGDSDIY